MMIDDLSTPLGRDRTRTHQSGPPLALSRSITVVVTLCAVVLAGWAWRADDRLSDFLGGEPIGVAAIHRDDGSPYTVTRPSQASVAKPDRPNRHDGPTRIAEPKTPPAAPTTKTITIIDGISGKQQEIIIPIAAQPASARR